MATLNRKKAIYHSGGYPSGNEECFNTGILHGPIGGDTYDATKEMKENRDTAMRMVFRLALLGNARDHKN